jgi:hypothetical protein
MKNYDDTTKDEEESIYADKEESNETLSNIERKPNTKKSDKEIALQLIARRLIREHRTKNTKQ